MQDRVARVACPRIDGGNRLLAPGSWLKHYYGMIVKDKHPLHTCAVQVSTLLHLVRVLRRDADLRRSPKPDLPVGVMQDKNLLALKYTS